MKLAEWEPVRSSSILLMLTDSISQSEGLVKWRVFFFVNFQERGGGGSRLRAGNSALHVEYSIKKGRGG